MIPYWLTKAGAAFAMLFLLHTGGMHHDTQAVEHQHRHSAPAHHLRHDHHRHVSHLRDRYGRELSYAHRPKSCAQLRRIWRDAGGSPGKGTIAAAEAMAESSGRWWLHNYNRSNGVIVSTDKGLWQINNVYWGRASTYRILGNARAAVRISHNGRDWQPWSSYQSGREVGFCGYR